MFAFIKEKQTDAPDFCWQCIREACSAAQTHYNDSFANSTEYGTDWGDNSRTSEHGLGRQDSDERVLRERSLPRTQRAPNDDACVICPCHTWVRTSRDCDPQWKQHTLHTLDGLQLQVQGCGVGTRLLWHTHPRHAFPMVVIRIHSCFAFRSWADVKAISFHHHAMVYWPKHLSFLFCICVIHRREWAFSEKLYSSFVRRQCMHPWLILPL